MSGRRPGLDGTVVLRRQREVRIVAGKLAGVYPSTCEIICQGCGDDPLRDYHEQQSRPAPAWGGSR